MSRVEELVARSAAQRAAIVAEAQPLLRTVETPDRVIAFLRRYPVPIALCAVAIALLGPRKVLGLGARAMTLYTLFRG